MPRIINIQFIDFICNFIHLAFRFSYMKEVSSFMKIEFLLIILVRF